MPLPCSLAISSSFFSLSSLTVQFFRWSLFVYDAWHEATVLYGYSMTMPYLKIATHSSVWRWLIGMQLPWVMLLIVCLARVPMLRCSQMSASLVNTICSSMCFYVDRALPEDSEDTGQPRLMSKNIVVKSLMMLARWGLVSNYVARFSLMQDLCTRPSALQNCTRGIQGRPVSEAQFGCEYPRLWWRLAKDDTWGSVYKLWRSCCRSTAPFPGADE